MVNPSSDPALYVYPSCVSMFTQSLDVTCSRRRGELCLQGAGWVSF